MDMEDEDRNNLLRLTEEKLMQFATACNRYPDVDIEIEDPEFEELEEGEEAEITVNLTREGLEEGEKLGPVISLAYPDKNEECWWIVAGDSVKNKVLGIKRVTFDSILSTKLKITAPEPGDYNVKIYLICDSYIGCDQEVSSTSQFLSTSFFEENELAPHFFFRFHP
jgi:pre-mRNA-splicing helicase BRR2